MTIPTIIAIILGPILAVLASLFLGRLIADRKQRRDLQFQILVTIVMMQWKGVSEEQVKALNLIDLFFHDAPKVRAKWSELFEAYCRRDLPLEEASELWRKKKIGLVHEMACHLGFGKTMQQLDFDRIYAPIGLGGNLDDVKTIDKLKTLLEKQKEDILSRDQGAGAKDPDNDS
jgi:hypothetical protein